MDPKPLPPAIELPGPFVIPELDYKEPSLKYLEWVPIPIYAKDIPKELDPKVGNSSQNKGAKNNAVPPAKKTPDSESDSDANADGIENENQSVNAENSKLDKLPAQKSEFKEVQTMDLPLVGEVPVPKPEIIVTAVSTAGVASVASVGGTLAATALFKHIMTLAKPLITFLLKKIAKIRGKKPPLTWARARVAQRQRRS